MNKENIKNYETKEQKLAELEYNLICDFLKLRKDHNLTQQEFADMSDTVRETIAKIETQVISPQINTLIKILEPLGYTLKIAKIDEDK